MTTVYWTPSNPSYYFDKAHPDYGVFKESYIVYSEPRPYLQYLFEKRGTDDVFTVCPAFIEYFKNTYVVTAPFDFTIDYSKGKLNFTGCDERQRAYLKVCGLDRTHDQPKGSLPLITTVPSYIAYSDSSVMMEVSQLHFTSADCNFHYVPGTFNIGKWIRPLDFTFEMKDPSKPIVFKRGDPLYIIRFLPEDRSKVELVRVEEDEDLINLVKGTIRVKTLLTKQSLDRLYKMASQFINLFLRKKIPAKQQSKCPFSNMFRK